VNALEELKKEIEDKYKGTKVFPIKLDVRDPDQVKGLLKELPAEVRDIDVLVNNAYSRTFETFPLIRGISGLVKGMEQVGDIAEDDIKVMIDTNVTGLINVHTPSLVRCLIF
jgi:3-hydroxy acid dehydrogenase / malonic semialdehyde reductase